MDYYAGIDVSLELSSVCILDASGQIVREAKVASEPEAHCAFLANLNLPLTRVGLEAGPLSQWLHAGLVQAGFEVVLLETRHVKAALSAMIVKTDRRDARGIAQLLRMGWFRPVHCKSPPAQEIRALLMARKQLQAKMRDVELSLRGLLVSAHFRARRKAAIQTGGFLKLKGSRCSISASPGRCGNSARTCRNQARGSTRQARHVSIRL